MAVADLENLQYISIMTLSLHLHHEHILIQGYKTSVRHGDYKLSLNGRSSHRFCMHAVSYNSLLTAIGLLPRQYYLLGFAFHRESNWQ